MLVLHAIWTIFAGLLCKGKKITASSKHKAFSLLKKHYKNANI